MERILRKYGVAATIDFALYDTTGLVLKSDAVYVAGDVKVMKDEGAETNTTNGFVDEGQGYSLLLTATEMQAARLALYVVDQGSKVWKDEVVLIETYGNASAQFPTDPAEIKVKTDLISAGRITILPSYDGVSQRLTLYRGDRITVTFSDLDPGLATATAVTLAIGLAGADDTALVELTGTVVSDTSLSVAITSAIDVLSEGADLYVYDLRVTVGGSTFSPIRKSPLTIVYDVDRA